jgi:hypothetical protein
MNSTKRIEVPIGFDVHRLNFENNELDLLFRHFLILLSAIIIPS